VDEQRMHLHRSGGALQERVDEAVGGLLMGGRREMKMFAVR
jgi:hypothetical protein